VPVDLAQKRQIGSARHAGAHVHGSTIPRTLIGYVRTLPTPRRRRWVRLDRGR
jgi:hypothetical protein